MVQDNISAGAAPSADWNQVKENILMLDTVVMQLGWTLREGDSSVDALTESFRSMVESAGTILGIAEKMEDGADKEMIIQEGKSIYEQMQRAIVAFQFYDKMSQRLNHAALSLENLAELIGNPVRLCDPEQWQSFQQEIRARYTSPADKVMFDAVLKGATLEEAIQLFNEYEAHSTTPDMVYF